MSKVILEGYIVVPDADLLRVQAELPNHIALTRKELGCLVFNVSQCKVHRNRFRVYEEFASQNDFEVHQERVHNSAWGAISRNVERHYIISSSD